MKTDLVQRYETLRARLQGLMLQPDRDMAAVDSLIAELARVQIEIKAELGVRGNNPNE